MDQQQATDYVLKELRAGRSRAEIAADLARQLRAPQQTLERFVARVEAQQMPTASAPTEAIPPRLQTVVEPARQGEEIQKIVPPSSLHPQAAAPAHKPTRKENPLDNPELAAFVLSALKKQHRRGDIVAAVCERGNLEWSQAHRFVSQVEIENHKQISTPRNVFLIGAGIGFIIAGAAMVVYGLSAIIPYFSHISVGEIPPVPLSQTSLAALLSGPLMILGGIAGIYLAIKEQIR